VTERTVTITITRKANRRTVELTFEGDLENITLAGDVDNPNDSEKFKELAEIVPGLHALDNNALRVWNQRENSDQGMVSSASNQFVVPDTAMSVLRRFRLRYTHPS
jgi:hypothetical protein